jgi:hypothetical protein
MKEKPVMKLSEALRPVPLAELDRGAADYLESTMGVSVGGKEEAAAPEIEVDEVSLAREAETATPAPEDPEDAAAVAKAAEVATAALPSRRKKVKASVVLSTHTATMRAATVNKADVPTAGAGSAVELPPDAEATTASQQTPQRGTLNLATDAAPPVPPEPADDDDAVTSDDLFTPPLVSELAPSRVRPSGEKLERFFGTELPPEVLPATERPQASVDKLSRLLGDLPAVARGASVVEEEKALDKLFSDRPDIAVEVPAAPKAGGRGRRRRNSSARAGVVDKPELCEQCALEEPRARVTRKAENRWLCRSCIRLMRDHFDRFGTLSLVAELPRMQGKAKMSKIEQFFGSLPPVDGLSTVQFAWSASLEPHIFENFLVPGSVNGDSRQEHVETILAPDGAMAISTFASSPSVQVDALLAPYRGCTFAVNPASALALGEVHGVEPTSVVLHATVEEGLLILTYASVIQVYETAAFIHAATYQARAGDLPAPDPALVLFPTSFEPEDRRMRATRLNSRFMAVVSPKRIVVYTRASLGGNPANIQPVGELSLSGYSLQPRDDFVLLAPEGGDTLVVGSNLAFAVFQLSTDGPPRCLLRATRSAASGAPAFMAVSLHDGGRLVVTRDTKSVTCWPLEGLTPAATADAPSPDNTRGVILLPDPVAGRGALFTAVCVLDDRSLVVGDNQGSLRLFGADEIRDTTRSAGATAAVYLNDAHWEASVDKLTQSETPDYTFDEERTRTRATSLIGQSIAQRVSALASFEHYVVSAQERGVVTVWSADARSAPTPLRRLLVSGRILSIAASQATGSLLVSFARRRSDQPPGADGGGGGGGGGVRSASRTASRVLSILSPRSSSRTLALGEDEEGTGEAGEGKVPSPRSAPSTVSPLEVLAVNPFAGVTVSSSGVSESLRGSIRFGDSCRLVELTIVVDLDAPATPGVWDPEVVANWRELYGDVSSTDFASVLAFTRRTSVEETVDEARAEHLAFNVDCFDPATRRCLTRAPDDDVACLVAQYLEFRAAAGVTAAGVGYLPMFVIVRTAAHLLSGHVLRYAPDDVALAQLSLVSDLTLKRRKKAGTSNTPVTEALIDQAMRLVHPRLVWHFLRDEERRAVLQA